MLAALLPSLRHVKCSYLIRALAGAAAAIPIRFPLAGCAVVAFLSLFCKDRALERDRPYQREKKAFLPLFPAVFSPFLSAFTPPSSWVPLWAVNSPRLSQLTFMLSRPQTGRVSVHALVLVVYSLAGLICCSTLLF